MHMASPGSRGLFRAAIMESNPWGLPIRTIADAASVRRKFYRKLGCSDITCARSKPVADIVSAADAVQEIPNPFKTPLAQVLTWTPIIDGKEILDQSIVSFAKGAWTAMPTLLGSNTDEGDAFVRLIVKSPLVTPLYVPFVTYLFGGNAGQVLRNYPASWKIGGDRNRATLSQLVSDLVFLCPTRAVARAVGAASPGNSFVYHFDKVLDYTPTPWNARYSFCQDKVCHGAELPVWFSTADTAGYTSSPADRTLSADMLTLWTNFAKSGVPGSTAAGVAWKPTPASGAVPYMRFATPASGLEVDYRKSMCDFWDTTGEY
jgi:carboxylesterase type B